MDPLTAQASRTAKSPAGVSAAACDHLLGPLRVRYLLYGTILALAAMVVQVVAIDPPTRDDEQLVSGGSPVARPPASGHTDPQVADKAPHPASEGTPPDGIAPAELAELLARARRQIEALALTSPPGDNALETLQRVLAAMPSQPDALQGIKDIAGKYAMLATQADKRGERDLAKRYLDRGFRLAPDHPDLLTAEKRLSAEAAFERGPSGPLQADPLGMAPIRPTGTSK